MATFVLLPGAGSDSWYWHLVVPELNRFDDHDVVAVDLPVTDDTADFSDYAERAVEVVAAMVPRPGESGAEWWVNTHHAEARGPSASDEMEAGHTPALSHPHELAQRILRYHEELASLPQ